MNLIPLPAPPQTIYFQPYAYADTPLVLACQADGSILRVRFVRAEETQAQALDQLRCDCARLWPVAYGRHAPDGFVPDLKTFRLYGTPFQQAVWRALAALPPGQTITYRELAQLVDKPGASRAIGNAVGANPYAPFVPCHRVLGSAKGPAAIGGFMRGYSGGLDLKRRLLAAEGITA